MTDDTKPKKEPSKKREVMFNGMSRLSGFAAQVVVTFVTAPIIVHGLGDDRYGIWSFVESILAYLMLYDMGLTASVIRYTSKYHAIQNQQKRDQILSTSIVLFGGIGVLALTTVILISVVGSRFVTLPEVLLTEAFWLFVLLGFNLGIGLPMAIFPGILAGLGKYPASTAIKTSCLVARAFVLVLAVTNGYGLIAVGLIVTAFGMLEHLLMFIAVRWYLPDYRFAWNHVSWSTFKEIRGYSIDAFIIAINQRISFKTDAIVIGLTLGPALITPFTLARKLVAYAQSSVRTFTSVLTPAVSNLDATGQTGAIRRLMIKGTRYVLWVVLPMEIGLLILGHPFLELWLGPRLAEMGYPVLFVLSLPLITSLSQSIATRILFGTSGIRWLARAGLVYSFCNIVLSLILVFPYGIVGVAIGTAVPYTVFNLFVEKHVCRKLGIGIGEYLGHAWLKPMLTCPILILVWLPAMLYLPITWASLVAITAAGLLVYGLAAALVEFGPRELAVHMRRVPGLLAKKVAA